MAEFRERDHPQRQPPPQRPQQPEQKGPPPIDFSTGFPADEDRPPIYATNFNLQVDSANTRIDLAELSQRVNWPRGALVIPTNYFMTLVIKFLALSLYQRMGKAVREAKNPVEEAGKIIDQAIGSLVDQPETPGNGRIIKP